MKNNHLGFDSRALLPLRLRRPQHGGKPARPDQKLLGGSRDVRRLHIRNAASCVLRDTCGTL